MLDNDKLCIKCLRTERTYSYVAGKYNLSYRADNSGKVYVDGNLVGEVNDNLQVKQVVIPENASIVAFEIGYSSGGFGFVASYDNGLATTVEQYTEFWRCTDNETLITEDWNLGSK